MARAASQAGNHARLRCRVAYWQADSAEPGSLHDAAAFMTVLSTTRHPARSSRGNSRNHMIPLLLGGVLAAGAVALVAYLLWPTWGAAELSDNPARLPVSIGGTLFNVPTRAVRMKIQRHSGPQERIDLGFIYPSLEPPQAPEHV